MKVIRVIDKVWRINGVEVCFVSELLLNML